VKDKPKAASNFQLLATLETQVLNHLVPTGVVGHVPAGFGVAEGLSSSRVRDASLEREALSHGDLTVEHPDGVAGTEADPGEYAFRLRLQFGGDPGANHARFGTIGSGPPFGKERSFIGRAFLGLPGSS
jgi:hypothetical protein